MDDNKTVHLADDDEDDRMLFKEALQEADPNIKVVEAQNGKELIDNIKNSDDLDDTVVVVDMNMPKMNGIETIKAIRDDRQIPDVPAVMLSTSNNPDLKKKAIEAGATDYFTKPNSFIALIDIAKKIFLKFFK
ncbi:response regulator [Dyadobacter subterraneus]|uniref:Response regulator n=1 Tax=Dyadobacter subterraneus TaxID=2773304 RepID=A0ABR9WA94_9BACT|nr:response regulator [Dyadobacter subterraneus]MBE9462054.1 response regulator [Dyadobacter subterraneus]